MVASRVPPTGDLAHNPGVCPDQELNWRPPGSQAGTQSTEPPQLGLPCSDFKMGKFHTEFRVPDRFWKGALPFRAGIPRRCQLALRKDDSPLGHLAGSPDLQPSPQQVPWTVELGVHAQHELSSAMPPKRCRKCPLCSHTVCAIVL